MTRARSPKRRLRTLEPMRPFEPADIDEIARLLNVKRPAAEIVAEWIQKTHASMRDHAKHEERVNVAFERRRLAQFARNSEKVVKFLDDALTLSGMGVTLAFAAPQFGLEALQNTRKTLDGLKSAASALAADPKLYRRLSYLTPSDKNRATPVTLTLWPVLFEIWDLSRQVWSQSKRKGWPLYDFIQFVHAHLRLGEVEQETLRSSAAAFRRAMNG